MKFKEILIGIIFLGFITILCWDSTSKLVDVCTILHNKDTATTYYSYVWFAPASSVKGPNGYNYIKFSFYANGKTYRITNHYFSKDEYHLTDLWSEGNIKRDEMFQVSYCKSNPYLCIPTKYINPTIRSALLYLALAAGFLTIYIWGNVVGRKKEKEKEKEKENPTVQ